MLQRLSRLYLLGLGQARQRKAHHFAAIEQQFFAELIQHQQLAFRKREMQAKARGRHRLRSYVAPIAHEMPHGAAVVCRVVYPQIISERSRKFGFVLKTKG